MMVLSPNVVPSLHESSRAATRLDFYLGVSMLLKRIYLKHISDDEKSITVENGATLYNPDDFSPRTIVFQMGRRYMTLTPVGNETYMEFFDSDGRGIQDHRIFQDGL
jgi:hypothetical protein